MRGDHPSCDVEECTRKQERQGGGSRVTSTRAKASRHKLASVARNGTNGCLDVDVGSALDQEFSCLDVVLGSSKEEGRGAILRGPE